MSVAIDRGRFARELAGWAVRGLLCALPSAYLAAAAEFNRPGEFAAMAVGTAVWITAFALVSSWVAMRVTAGRERFVRALKMAAWIKAALLAGAGVAWVPVLGLKSVVGIWFVLGVVPDMWAGAASLWLVSQLAGTGESLSVGAMNSFGWTLVVTLVQGALISLLLGLLALGVLGWGRVWPRLKQLSPTRIPG